MSYSDDRIECPACGALVDATREHCPVCRLDLSAAQNAAASKAGLREADAGSPGLGEEPEPFRSPEGGAGPCYVCVAEETKPNPVTLGPLLQSFTGVSKLEAANQVTHGMGVLADSLSPDTANNMVEALAEEGVEAFAVPRAAVPPLDRRISYNAIYGVDEDGLHVEMDSDGAIRSVGWAALVAGVCVKDPSGPKHVRYRTERGPMVPTIHGPARGRLKFRKEVKNEEPPLQVVLLLQDGSGNLHVLRVTEDDVRYAYLGDRLMPSREHNFVQFMSDLLDWSGAFFPASFRRVAGGALLRARKTAGKVRRQNYLHWAACCAVRRGLVRTG